MLDRIIIFFVVLIVCGQDVDAQELTFAGRVSKPDGTPAANAVVYLASQFGNELLEPPVSVHCDAAGRFSGLTTSVYRTATLQAVSADRKWQSIAFIPFARARTVAAEPVEVVLSPVRKTAVRVLKEDKPVENCLVALRGIIASGVVTDGSGNATLLCPPLSYWHKNVVAFHKTEGVAGWSSETRTDPLPKLLELSLQPTSERTLKVIDQRNNPIKNLNLSQGASYDNRWASLESLPESWLTTNDQGLADVDWLPAKGRVFVKALSKEWSLTGALPDTSGKSITIRLARKYLFQGRVRFPDGRPCANVGVIAAGANNVATSWARTDKDGSFRLYLAADQVYRVGIQDSEWISAERVGVFVRTSGGKIEYERRGAFLTAKPGIPLEVKVLDVAGNPIANAWIYSRSDSKVRWNDSEGADQRSNIPFKGWRLTDSAGIARFAVAPGVHEMRASVPGWQLERKIEVVEGQRAKLTLQEPRDSEN